MTLAVDRYELMVAFSSRIDDWGMVTDPDDFDDRSHDTLVTEYRNKLQRLSSLERADNMSEHDLLVGYANWLDDNGMLRSWGPGEEGMELVAERFLKERSR